MTDKKMKMEIPNRRLTLRQAVTGLLFGKMSQVALAMVRGLDRFARWSTARGLVSMGVDRGTAREMVEIAAGGGEVTVKHPTDPDGPGSGWTEIGKTPGGGTVYVAGADAIDAMRTLLSGDCPHCDHYRKAKPCCFCGGVVLLS